MNYRLKLFLNSVAAIAVDADEIRKHLGIESLDSKSDEFWQHQIHGAKQRYYNMLLAMDGELPLATNATDLDDFDLGRLQKLSDNFHKSGKTYADVRKWWKNQGSFLFDKAVKLRKEKRKLANLSLVIMCVVEKKQYWIAYDAIGNAYLTTKEMAQCFPVEDASQLEEDYLIEMSKHLDSLKEQFNSTIMRFQVKKVK